MLHDMPAFTRWLSCADCDSELFVGWYGPDIRFDIEHSATCPTGEGPERHVRLLLADAAPDQTPERPPR